MSASATANRLRFSEEIRVMARRLGSRALLSLACDHAHRIFDANLESNINEAEVVDEIVKAALREDDMHLANPSTTALRRTASLLATVNGFALRDTATVGQYKLIDGATCLPQLNPSQNRLWFTLGEAFAFLESRPLHSPRNIGGSGFNACTNEAAADTGTGMQFAQHR